MALAWVSPSVICMSRAESRSKGSGAGPRCKQSSCCGGGGGRGGGVAEEGEGEEGEGENHREARQIQTPTTNCHKQHETQNKHFPLWLCLMRTTLVGKKGHWFCNTPHVSIRRYRAKKYEINTEHAIFCCRCIYWK